MDEVFAGEQSFTSNGGTRGYYGRPELTFNRDPITGEPIEMLMRIENADGTKALPKGFRLKALQLRNDPAVNYQGVGARARNEVLYVPAPPPEIKKEAIFIPGLGVEPVTGDEFYKYRDFMLMLFYEFNQEQINPNWGVNDFESFKKMYEESGGMIPARPGVMLGWFKVSADLYSDVIETEPDYKYLPMDKPLVIGHPTFVITDGTGGDQPGVKDLMYPRITGSVVEENQRAVTVGAPVTDWTTKRELRVTVAWEDTRYNLKTWRYREGDALLIAEQADERAGELMLFYYACLFPREVGKITAMWKRPSWGKYWATGFYFPLNYFGHVSTGPVTLSSLFDIRWKPDALAIATPLLGIPKSFRRVAGEEEM